MATSIIPRASNDDYTFGTAVELSKDQEYTAPGDGYLTVTGPYLGTGDNNYTRCQIGGISMITVGYGISGTSQQVTLFVKKNMVITPINFPPSGNGGAVKFYPLV